MATPKSAALEELERILASPGFAKNDRLSRFLRFLVENQLEGRGVELKESLIGVEVFGRLPDYNPRRDSIVRTEAGRLRARLAEYYANGGRRDVIVIELHKGGYVPEIRPAELQPPRTTRSSWRLRALIGIPIVLCVLIIAGSALLLWRKDTPATAPARMLGNSQRLRHYAASPAFDLYRQARTAYHPGREIPDANVDLYQQAIAKDPMLAPAFAGLAAAYAFSSSKPIGRSNNNFAKMRLAAQEAVQLDPLLPESHDAMGVVYAHLGLWEAAQRSFRRAIQLDPGAPAVRLDYAMNVLVPLGWISNALQQLRLAEQSDPHSPDVHDTYAYVLISAGQFDRAELHCPMSLEPRECMGRVRLGQGRIEEALQILASAPNSRYLGYAYGSSGRRVEAEKLAAISPGALQQVLIYSGLGDKDRTFEALDRMAELGPGRVGRTLTFPELAFLRGDLRVKILRRKVGLPE